MIKNILNELTKEGMNVPNEEIVQENEKWFKIIRILPALSSVVLMGLVFLFGLIILCAPYGPGFGVTLLIWVAGFIVSICNYFILKIIMSVTILQISYLRKISEKE